MNIIRLFKQTSLWKKLPQAKLRTVLNLENFGGAELFIHDINDDGLPEFLWLQSKGIFKSDLYLNNKRLGAHIHHPPGDMFCLTATRVDGSVIWQYGTPFSEPDPYISHAGEMMITCCDIDGDGHVEVLALRKQELLVLEGNSGRLKNSCVLPQDNFAAVTTFCNTSNSSPVILVSVMADSYPPYTYGNPTLFLDKSLNILHLAEHIGSGHRIPLTDADGDGAEEALLGYQMVKSDGTILWTLDLWQGKQIDPFAQHVDQVSHFKWNGRDLFAIAGSDRLYLIDSTGVTIWSQMLPHPQYCLIGRFDSSDSRPSLFVTNRREMMHGFDLDGHETWRRMLPENWPMGKPNTLARPFHKGVPAVVWHSPDLKSQDIVVYSEAGWPYGVNGSGRLCLRFPHTGEILKPACANLPNHRPDDFGLSFSCAAYDIDRDGNEEMVIFDRRYAWIYSWPSVQ